MGRLLFAVLCLAALSSGAAHAQFVPVPAPPSYAINPPASASPLQQQMLRNYRSQLQQTQRELARQNPTGISREQLEINRQLNAFNPGLNPVTPPSASITPPAAAVTPPGILGPAPFP
jgi:hypothetical protein